MSWDCPHLKKDECIRLKKTCRPLQKGCVLEGKVQYIDDQLNKREENKKSDSTTNRKTTI